MKPIITHLTDTDLYKFFMGNVALQKHPNAWVKYKFKCRNDINLAQYCDEIREQIHHLCTLRFTPIELSYIYRLGYFNKGFIEFLRLLQLNPDHILIYVEKGELCIYVEGPWITTIWFEIPVLSIVSEVYARHQPKGVLKEGEKRLKAKIDFLTSQAIQVFFAEFGGRRRAFFDFQHKVLIPALKTVKTFVGTSNVYCAMDHGIKAIGTMAHEYLMAYQQLTALKNFQRQALQDWADVYRGSLGIALTDTVGMDAFLRDFDLYFAKLFDGGRHDSGDPYTWGHKWIKHIEGLGLDPTYTTGVFSDGLNFKKAIQLAGHFQHKLKPSFGIGTWLTNDMGFETPNLVMKMIECNGSPVAKIPDSSGKGMCESPEFEATVRHTFNIKEG